MSKEGKRGRSHCPTASALEFVGDRWSLLILRDYIFKGYREYGEFLHHSEEGIATNILASRLAWLVENGMLTKHPHPTNRRKSYYGITPKGFDLIGAIMELARWGWTHLPETWAPDEIRLGYLEDPAAFAQTWRERHTRRTEEYLADASSRTPAAGRP